VCFLAQALTLAGTVTVTVTVTGAAAVTRCRIPEVPPCPPSAEIPTPLSTLPAADAADAWRPLLSSIHRPLPLDLSCDPTPQYYFLTSSSSSTRRLYRNRASSPNSILSCRVSWPDHRGRIRWWRTARAVYDDDKCRRRPTDTIALFSKPQRLPRRRFQTTLHRHWYRHCRRLLSNGRRNAPCTSQPYYFVSRSLSLP
jgi:hypothetical protein